MQQRWRKAEHTMVPEEKTRRYIREEHTDIQQGLTMAFDEDAQDAEESGRASLGGGERVVGVPCLVTLSLGRMFQPKTSATMTMEA